MYGNRAIDAAVSLHMVCTVLFAIKLQPMVGGVKKIKLQGDIDGANFYCNYSLCSRPFSVYILRFSFAEVGHIKCSLPCTIKTGNVKHVRGIPILSTGFLASRVCCGYRTWRYGEAPWALCTARNWRGVGNRSVHVGFHASIFLYNAALSVAKVSVKPFFLNRTKDSG